MTGERFERVDTKQQTRRCHKASAMLIHTSFLVLCYFNLQQVGVFGAESSSPFALRNVFSSAMKRSSGPRYPSLARSKTDAVNSIRGGDLHLQITSVEQQQQQQQQQRSFRVDLWDLSLALRWTGEINRQLQQPSLSLLSQPQTIKTLDALSCESEKSAVMAATREEPHFERSLQQQHQVDRRHEHYNLDGLRGGAGGRYWGQPPAAAMESKPYRIPAVEIREPVTLTVFDAKQPRAGRAGKQQQPCGASYWGPDLYKYLTVLSHTLELDGHDASLEWSLAMIYLDRATSADTPRSSFESMDGTSSSIPPVPYCTPRTVHRLILTALLLSLEAIHGSSVQELYHYGKLDSLGIPLAELVQMTDWMRGALGDYGYHVSPDLMGEWKRTWESKFPQKPKQKLNRNKGGSNTQQVTKRTTRVSVKESLKSPDKSNQGLNPIVQGKTNTYQSNEESTDAFPEYYQSYTANESTPLVGIRVHN